MAQRLQEKFSPDMCISLAYRHMRLNSQTKGAEVLTSAIEPMVADVEMCVARVNTAEAEKNSSYDLTLYMDTELDNAVKTTADRCIAYDREHPMSQVYKMVFPENTYAITNTYHLKESAEVKKVISRLETLDQAHPLRAEIAILTAMCTKVDQTIQAYYDSINKLASAKAARDIAKVKLVRQYTANMFDAEKMFGRANANRLFPQVVSRSEKDDTGVTPDTQTSGATVVAN